MSQPWASVFVGVSFVWTGVILTGMFALRALLRRSGREQAWPAVHKLIPWVDLIGTWLGTVGVIALALGRAGYTFEWASCMGLFAVMITVSLYDRAVLMPSLDAAFKRTGKGEQHEKWEQNWRLLWRMSAVGRVLILLMAVASLLLALLRFFA